MNYTREISYAEGVGKGLIKLGCANITDMGAEKQMQIFGDLKEDRVVIRLLNKEDFRSGYLVEETGQKYRILKVRNLKRKMTIYAGEFNGRL